MRRKAPRIVIGAPASGCGKTLVTCGILSAFKQAGKKPAAFKCGPDYIDPLFHETVLGTPSKNLDTFFAGRELTRQLFLEDAKQADISVVEGVMGLYDGLAGVSVEASTWDVAEALDAPVILVVEAAKASVSVLAMIRGFMDFAGDKRIRGVIFNRLSPARYPALKKMTQERLGIHVCGFLPKMEGIHMESRHLGLVMPQEIEDMKAQMERTGRQCLDTLDMELLEKIASEAAELEEKTFIHVKEKNPVYRPVIAVAEDKAFSFYYKDNIRLLEKMGARIRRFSPLYDSRVPGEADGLILGGGYPELHAGELAENVSMKTSIHRALSIGMPCMAECGGFLYLQRELEDSSGKVHRMTGFLDGKSFYTGKLSRFGYVTLTAERNGLLLKQGETVRGHEFHYMDTDCNGADFLAEKPVTGKKWKCGHASDLFYAGFPHLYLYSCAEMAQRFVGKAEQYGRKKKGR